MPVFMRYGDGGGVNQAGRARREQIRHRAAAMFAEGIPAPEVAAVLEVSTKAAYGWRRAWVAGGAQALASKGSPGPQPTLSQVQVD
jgi:putative transposase